MKRKKILLIDNFEQETIDLRRALISAGHEVHVIQKSEELSQALKETVPDLIIVETRLAGLRLGELISTVRKLPDKKVVPIVATGSPRTIEERVAVLEQEVDDFIYKPYDVDELLARVDNLLTEAAESGQPPSIISKGFSGSLAEMSLVDLLQTLEVGKKTGVISLATQHNEGRVFVTEGEVVDAQCNDLEPRKALLRMFTWLEGHFAVEMKDHERPKKIFVSTREIISEGMTRQFRWDQLSKGLPPLSALLEKEHTVSTESASNDELQILQMLDAPRPLLSLVEESKFDDIKALRLIKALYERGLIKKSAITQHLLGAGKRQKKQLESENGVASGEVLARAFTEMLHAPGEIQQNAQVFRRIERRRRERRRSDRFRSFGNGQRIWLNKTELVMIREKLLAGLKLKT